VSDALFTAGLVTLSALALGQTAFLWAEGPDYTPLQKFLKCGMIAVLILACLCFAASGMYGQARAFPIPVAGSALLLIGFITAFVCLTLLLSGMKHKASFVRERRLLTIALWGLLLSGIGIALIVCRH